MSELRTRQTGLTLSGSSYFSYFNFFLCISAFRKTDINMILLTTGHFGIWVLPQVSIQNSITDLVTNLVCWDSEHNQ